jgi:hypothetical protein
LFLAVTGYYEVGWRMWLFFMALGFAVALGLRAIPDRK